MSSFDSLKTLAKVNVKVGPLLQDSLSLKIERGSGSCGFDTQTGIHKFVIMASPDQMGQAQSIEFNLNHICEAWVYKVKSTGDSDDEGSYDANPILQKGRVSLTLTRPMIPSHAAPAKICNKFKEYRAAQLTFDAAHLSDVKHWIEAHGLVVHSSPPNVE